MFSGHHVQITGFRPNVSRSILNRVLNDSIVSRQSTITRMEKSRLFEATSLHLFKNKRNLSVAEILPDKCSYAICIPEGHWSSGWKAFENALLQHRKLLRHHCLPPSRNETLSTKIKLPSQTSWRTLRIGKVNKESLQTFFLGQIFQIHFQHSTPSRKTKPLPQTNGREPSLTSGLTHLKRSKKLPLLLLKNVISDNPNSPSVWR